MGLLSNLFSEEKREISTLEKIADQVLSHENEMAALSDDQLKEKTEEYKKRLAEGETVDDLLPEAFATAREAAYRVINEKPYRVQVMGAVAMHKGDIAEMKTGEGKTLTATMAVYLNALAGQGVHVITVNEYLAGRDAAWMGEIYRFLGLSVGVNKRELKAKEKREAYACDITYTTNSELGFDYLRDNMVTRVEDRVMRGLHMAIIDEVDSVLIDESRTPLIISGGKKETANLYIQADKFAKTLVAPEYETDRFTHEKHLISGDYDIDEKTRQVMLSEDGVHKAEKYFHIKNLYDIEHTQLVHHINQALKANYIFTNEVEYVVSDDQEIVIVDQFTGRLMPGRAYSDGLHQAIEAKEGVPIKEETSTLATITYQNFFRLYEKLAGMTGTAKTEEEEFLSTYNMKVVVIPTNRPVIREDQPDEIYAHKDRKYKALVEEVKRLYAKGQPVLVGTIAVETSELISNLLKKEGIPHEVLNAKNHAREAEIIAKAGRPKSVTIATNMAGRGTDIKLTKETRELGGLAVLGSERHESRRIDNQLRGRSGRQGDPGFSRFYVSLEDNLMVRFGGDKLQKMFEKLGDEQVQSKAVTRSITMAQKRVEGFNFDMRKQLLDYDDVLRRQREIIYAQRNRILESDEVHEMVHTIFDKAIEETLQANIVDAKKQTVDPVSLSKSFDIMGMQEEKQIKPDEIEGKSYKEIEDYAKNKIWGEYEKEIQPVKKQFLPFERTVVLRNIDRNWIAHIDRMDKLRSGIYLRSYAQNNPLQQYVQEGFDMFEEMNRRIDREITFFLCKVRIRRETKA
ncbi:MULTISPECIES: preprotein translocase subunit SecA [Faecalicoccus]|uniref:Protein translocase subunit SecA n=1 Tax=Faecalicoccus pleomorphus TaxID=1323 RepID=A0A7X9NLA3_9FIRM|nr:MULTISPECIES: preprotein translocase subunit SecA [Faecalicoccus]MBE6120760.1 preprotein translocase subunit SecA [Erysipelotrichaceae bacterium]MCI6380243.1 preprotein translocase subunit SecA [Erysipelotrichaceae bacterium]MDB7980002.1 preprotein translocase subunit SecA [Faecalicoccus pleomorphus]MDB7982212.1 preprotein translocase subunit SecA [Faecalicoccus pleomorphus]MDY4870513.1 preprotein translocase subunit SecA [Faecalicoccus sp.]